MPRKLLLSIAFAGSLFLPTPTLAFEPEATQLETQEQVDLRRAKWISSGTVLKAVEAGDFDFALNIANQLVDKYPDFPPFWLTRGIALLRSGQADKAYSDFQEAERLYIAQHPTVPTEEKQRYMSGLHHTYLHLVSYELPDRRVPSFSFRPDAGEIDLKAIAILFLQAERYDRVEEVATYASLKYPHLARPYYQRAIARHELGRIEEARADFEEAQRRYTKELESELTEEERAEVEEALREIEEYLSLQGETSEI